MYRRSTNPAEDRSESSATAPSRTELLESAIGLTRRAKVLAERASEPAAPLHLARAIVTLKSGRARLTTDKDTDVIRALMRMALALLDREDEMNVSLHLQRAIDELEAAAPGASAADIDQDILAAYLHAEDRRYPDQIR